MYILYHDIFQNNFFLFLNTDLNQKIVTISNAIELAPNTSYAFVKNEGNNNSGIYIIGIENGTGHTTVDILLISFTDIIIIARRHDNDDYEYVYGDGYTWLRNHTDTTAKITIKQILAF